MKDKIAALFFDSWCDGEIGSINNDRPELYHTIDSITEKFQLTGMKDYLFIEKTLSALVSEYEYLAFRQGFFLCWDLLNNKLWEDTS